MAARDPSTTIPSIESTPTQAVGLESLSSAVPRKPVPAKIAALGLLLGVLPIVIAAIGVATFAGRVALDPARLRDFVILPDVFSMIEAGALVGVGMICGPLPYFFLLWLSHGGNATPSRLLDGVCVLYGTLTLAVPFTYPLLGVMPVANISGGVGLMGQGLLLWIAYWKMWDVVGGTRAPAVLASPLNLAAHLFVLVEYEVAKPDATGAARSPASARRASKEDFANASPGPWWRNRGLLKTPVAPYAAIPLQLLEALTTCLQISALGSLRLLPAPRWLAASPYGAALCATLFAYSSVWVVYLNLKAAADGCALALTALGFVPKTTFREPLTASTSPTDFWSRRWNMIVRGLFHRTIFTPLRNRGVPAQLAALSAFVVSGAFHEYAFLPVNGMSTFGCEMLFFLSQAAFCTLELALRSAAAPSSRLAVTTRAVSMGALGGRPLDWQPPEWLKVVGTSLLLVPFSPLFMAPLRDGGTLDAMLALQVRVRVV